MSVLNKYKNKTSKYFLLVDRKNQLDFVLSQCTTPTKQINASLTKRGIISYFDFTKSLTALPEHYYDGCINENPQLLDLNLTGYDNGLLQHINNNDDCLLQLHEVSGNSGLITYDSKYVNEEKEQYYSFNGGFLQGYYKLEGLNYDIFPHLIDNIDFEFVIRPRTDYIQSGLTLNEINENTTKGIFFYIGTRAENKFAQYYNKLLDYDLKITETNEGRPLNTNQYEEILTDNKYLFFNRTKEGFTTNTWEDGDKVLLTGLKASNKINYYTIFNRTKEGFTTHTYNKEDEILNEKYDVLSDLLNNAFALKLNEDNSISYRYLAKDCNNEEKFSIKEEKTFPNMILDDEWNVIHLRFQIISGSTDKCGEPFGERKMRVLLYINGYLKLVSQELPALDLKGLNDMYDKQESVPYNISIGGGTQGLIDALTPDRENLLSVYSYLEKNFAGSFIGDIRSFKIYNNPLEYNEIKNNFLYEMNNRKQDINKTIIYYGFGKSELDVINYGQIMTANKEKYNKYISTSTEDEEHFYYIITNDYIGSIATEFTCGGAPMVMNKTIKDINGKLCIIFKSGAIYPNNTELSIISANF